MRNLKKHKKQAILGYPIYGEDGSDLIDQYRIADISVIKEGTIKFPTYTRNFDIFIQGVLTMFEFVRTEIRYLLILIRLKLKKSSDITQWNCYYSFYDNSLDDGNDLPKQNIFGIIRGECLGEVPVSVAPSRK